MKSTSSEYASIANSSSALYHIKAVVDNTTINDTIEEFEYNGAINDDEGISFGNAFTQICSFSITNPTINLQGKEITIYQGLELSDSTIEYVKLGIFKVLKPNKDRNKVTYTCVDRMTSKLATEYKSELAFPTTDERILNEICTQVGITFVKPSDFVSHGINKTYSGQTARDLIAYLAMLQGKNAIINEDGNLELRWYSTVNNYVIDSSKIYLDGTNELGADKSFIIEHIKCQVKDVEGETGNVLTVGDIDGTGISITNPFMTQTILNDVWSKIGGMSLYPSEIEFLGDFRLDLGDIVQINSQGNLYNMPIMKIHHTCDGGLVTTITSITETDEENVVDTSNPIQKTLERYLDEIIVNNKKIHDNGTEISVIQGQITNKIWQSDIDDVEDELNEKISTVEQSVSGWSATIESMQKQLDGAVATYTVTEPPTLDNYPANTFFIEYYPPVDDASAADYNFPSTDNTWIFTDESLKSHLGAVCYLSGGTSSYKFIINSDGEFAWQEIENSETAILYNQIAALDVRVGIIESRVTTTEETVGEYGTRITKAESDIKQTDSSITQLVTYTGYDGTGTQKTITAQLGLKLNKNDLSTEINAIADKINLDGATKINIKSGGYINITGDYLTINSSNFKVTKDGKITATNADITGTIKATSGSFSGTVNASSGTFTNGTFTNCNIKNGSIDITTSSQSDDKIKLSYGDWTCATSPLQYQLKNTSINMTATLQAGGLFIQKGTNNVAYIGESGVNVKSDLVVGGGASIGGKASVGGFYINEAFGSSLVGYYKIGNICFLEFNGIYNLGYNERNLLWKCRPIRTLYVTVAAVKNNIWYRAIIILNSSGLDSVWAYLDAGPPTNITNDDTYSIYGNTCYLCQ